MMPFFDFLWTKSEIKKKFFCPKDVGTFKLNITKNSYTIHHFNGSWLAEEDKYAAVLREKYRKVLPNGIARCLAKFNAIKKCRGFKAAMKETCKWLKR